MDKLVTLLVHCSSNNSLITEFFAKIKNGKFVVGAKRIYKPKTDIALCDSGNSGGGVDANKILSDGNEIVLINKVTWECLHCKNGGSWVLCNVCNTLTCQNGVYPFDCAGCGKTVTSTYSITHMGVNESKPTNKPETKKTTPEPSRSRLSKNTPDTKRLK